MHQQREQRLRFDIGRLSSAFLPILRLAALALALSLSACSMTPSAPQGVRIKPAEVFESCNLCLVYTENGSPASVAKANAVNMECFSRCELKRKTAAEWIKNTP